jgi:type VI secretion system secreted protein VgrG
MDTPLGKDVLIVRSISAVENISQLFEIDADLVSDQGEIAFEDIMGKSVTVEIRMAGGSSRYFNGIVSRFSLGGTYALGGEDRALVSYKAEIVPWLWTLTRTSNCRVWENKTVLEIIDDVFGSHRYSDYEFSRLGGDYEPIEYCVQYRETDFNFVSRMMEEEGLAYWFRHESGNHTMVIFDTSATCPDCPGFEQMVYGGTAGGAGNEAEIDELTVSQVMPPGKYALNGYDFTNPSDDLLAPTKTALSMGGNAKWEIYDVPSNYIASKYGSRYVKLRMEAEEAGSHQIQGSSVCAALSPGSHVTLKGYFRESLNNKRYLLVGVQHFVTESIGYEDADSSYENLFSCLPERIPYRPMQTTPKPSIAGTQTAVVVGPSDEEIHCDKYGRVRIQFHWDRRGKSDGTDVCWARVAQASAGKKWGALFTPRIGQEVVVTFLDGDPDRPLITGVVYNAEHMPPYEIPTNKTMWALKTRSSLGGDGFNELRFEDKKGEEQIFLHAERNWDLRVKNDAFDTIESNRHLDVKKDDFVHVENNRHQKIDQDRFEEIGKDRHLTIKGKSATEISDSLSLTVTGDVVEVFKGNHSERTTGDLYLKATGVTVEALSGITLKVGGSAVVIDSAGVTLKGATLTLDGDMVRIASGPGSPAMSGTAGNAVTPSAPEVAFEADDADPGKVAKLKSQQMESNSGKYGAEPVTPFRPPKDEAAREEKTWIEIELVDEEGNPVPGERYEVTLPDGEQVASGTLDQNGFARIEGVDPGQCQVSFPSLDKDAWEKA